MIDPVFHTPCPVTRFAAAGWGLQPRWGRIGEFLEVDCTHAFEGTLSQFTRFLRELEGSGSFVRVNSFTCTVEERPPASRRSDPRITVALNVSTFRFDAR